MHQSNRIMKAVLFCLFTVSLSSLASAADDAAAAPHWPGVQADGRTLLPNQWTLQPAGKQIPLGDFPVHIAVHPSGAWAAVLHCGYGTHEIVVVDLKRNEIASRTKLQQSFYGLTFDPEGKRLFASGGEFEVVHQFTFANGELTDAAELRTAEAKAKEIPTGLACSRDGKTLYVANGWGSRISFVPLDRPTKLEHLQLAKDSYPYTVLPTRDGQRLYASLWGDGSVAVIDLPKRKTTAVWPVGIASLGGATSHPTEMVLSPDEKLLYVACSNGNSVVVVNTATGRASSRFPAPSIPRPPTAAPRIASPSRPTAKCCWWPMPTTTTSRCSTSSEPGKSRSLGFIPVGWYPTSVRFTPGDKQILVANGKGMSPRRIPTGPNPLGSQEERRSNTSPACCAGR